MLGYLKLSSLYIVSAVSMAWMSLLALATCALLDVAEDIRQNDGRQQADDDHDHHDFDEREAAGGTMQARVMDFPWEEGLSEDRGRMIANER